MSDLHRKLMGMMPGGAMPPRAPSTKKSPGETARGGRARQRDYSLIPWTNYFDRFEEVVVDADTKFRVYVKGHEGPAFFFLHGGGFSALSWSLLSVSLASKIKCQCYCLDIRGHGASVTNNDEDLSIETMTSDVISVINQLWKDESASPPQIVLVGHSMGGALAVHVAISGQVKHLAGLVVIDVVEGSALDALSSMQSFLQGRPKLFNSIEQAVEYHVRSGAIRNVESARVSIIGQLKKLEIPPGKESSCMQAANMESPIDASHAVMQTEIAEEDDEAASSEEATKQTSSSAEQKPASADDGEFKKPQAIPGEKYEWRIDLTKTEKFWKDWFRGLSTRFLSVNVPKLLLLAGVDRLDKELMVGQMQGKFQMQVLPQCGHAVHEDAPDDVSDALANFVIRYKLAQAIDSVTIGGPNISC